MLSLIKNINLAIFIFFTVINFYRFIYIIIGLRSKRKKKPLILPKKLHKYAVIIAARNEQAVIGELIHSIKNQNYPRELIDIFVVADNCTDHTAQTAREAGAIVYERFNQVLVGKGYALDFIFGEIARDYPENDHEGYLVLDADNLLDENYVAEINKVFDKGYKVVTSYRNSKNYDHNWISAGYALWFLHEAEYLNNPRMILGKSCAVSGTGFLVDSNIIRKQGGWKHFLLTEDIEFSVNRVLDGETIGYCGTAVLYDEQPCTFKQSWNQRMRWSKGFYQVFGKYGYELFKGIFLNTRHRFSCYDIMMTIMPALLVSFASLVFNSFFMIGSLVDPVLGHAIFRATFQAICSWFVAGYGLLFVIGTITMITERQKIHAPIGKRIFSLFTFPLFMFTYLPIAIVALFKKVEWKPISHTCVKSLKEVREYTA